MKADTVELLGLFETDVRYLVPIFQRNYKWDQEIHWGPLWTDLCNVAEDVLEFGDTGEVVDHFLGAIVCEQAPIYGRDAKAISVIDGQQRLTTLALFLAALQNACAQRGFDEDADYLWPFVNNKDSVVRGRLEHRYKVWPNPADRADFVAAMQGGGGESRPERGLRFFRDKIDRWLDVGQEDDPSDDAANTPQERMSALITAVTRYVKLVKIDLEPNDNAQLIFETLNGRGERLTDADLIRNALFRQADQEAIDTEILYRTYWASFDNPQWSKQIAHGRHQRDRLSMYLNHWLSMKELTEIQASALFRCFREYARTSQLPADAIAKDMAQYGTVFDSFDQFQVNSREWWFFRRIAEMDLITVYPVLLYLFGLPEESFPRANRTRAVLAIESFLVRRLIARASTRGYGTLFIEVLKAAGTGDPAESDRRIIELLAGKTAETDHWPTDDETRFAVMNTNVYKLKQSRLKMILEAIDVHRSQGGNTETITLGHSLWIEHLLPQTWDGAPTWALPGDLTDPTAAALARNHTLHTLGNLTLTTSKLDISLSNRPWGGEARTAEAPHRTPAQPRPRLHRTRHVGRAPDREARQRAGQRCPVDLAVRHDAARRHLTKRPPSSATWARALRRAHAARARQLCHTVSTPFGRGRATQKYQ